MKRLLCTVLALLMAAALLTSALAVEVTLTKELNVRDLVTGKTTFMALSEDLREWALYDATLEPVSDARFADCKYKTSGEADTDYYVVSDGSLEYDMYKMGVIDGKANMIIPCKYNDLDMLGDGWFGGIVYTTATVDNYDMKYTFWNSDEVVYYLYDRIDIWKENKMVVTLDRTQYDDYVSHCGEYLVMKGRDNVARFIAPDGTMTVMEEYGEFIYDFSKKTITHNPTGTPAFTAGCTLTEDQVLSTRYEVDGKVLDLQGNVVFSIEPGEHISRFYGNLTTITNAAKKFGVIDVNGNRIFPCQFDRVYSADDLNKYGYASVEIDGKFGAICADGRITVQTTYPFDSVDSYSSYWGMIQDLDGSYRVISKEIGEFTTSTENVYPTNGFALTKDADGNGKLYHYDGTLIADMINLSESKSTTDNRIVLVRQGYGSYYYAYVLADDSAAEAQPAEVQPQGSPADIINAAIASIGDVIQPPQVDTTELWTCPSCANINDGKFCPECGTPRPAEAVCANCGYKAPDGGTFKFCPECGTKAQ